MAVSAKETDHYVFLARKKREGEPMSKKVLTVFGILLLMAWSVSAAPAKGGVVDRAGSHVGIEFAGSAQTGEADALVGPDVWPARSRQNLSRDTADTLVYQPADGTWNAQFIQSPGDYMMMAYQMPADGYIKGVNVPVYEWGTGDQQMTISIHKLAYPNGADGTPFDLGVVDEAGWIGGYDLDETTGNVSISGDTYTPAGTTSPCGGTVADNARDPLLVEETAVIGPIGTPYAGLIWPDNVIAATLDPTNNPDISNGGGDNWINTADFGTEPFVEGGTWIGILVASTGAGGGDDPATGFLYEEGDGVVSPWVALKFYGASECSGTSGNNGWHIRHWMFDFELAVLLTGDRAPQILDWTSLGTTLSTDDREVTATIIDDNPSGGEAGVASASLWYSTDGVDFTEVAMTDNGDDTFTGSIPGQAPGTDVWWYISATDVLGNTSEIPVKYYSIFQAVKRNLFFYNASDFGSWVYGYYTYNVDLEADWWDGANYGAGSDELYVNYDFVCEVTGSGPSVINNVPIRTFVEGGGNYVLTGDEWLGAQTGWVNQDYQPGDFHYDILGIDADYNDINYCATGDQGGISRLLAVDGDVLSGDLAAFLADSLDLNYDPNYELGFSNWLDGVDPVDGINVAFYGIDCILDTNYVPTGTDTFATALYHETSAGARVVFIGFDPLATNTSPSYHWIGVYPFGPLQEAILWAAPELGVSGPGNEVMPSEFALHGNYPNPFNPSTNIAFTMDVRSPVTLRVYSLLGKEIATIHGGVLNPGSHEITWNGVDNLGNPVASGVYLYRIEAGERALTGKMMLLK
jgi:hypothetical protein